MKSPATAGAARVENLACNTVESEGTHLDRILGVLTVLFALIALGTVGFRVTTAEERTRMLRRVSAVVREIRDAAIVVRQQGQPFREALRARTRWALVTPALVALNAAVFMFMVGEPGPSGHPDTLVRWGGSVGPLTTNGEWWRIVTTLFVHTGPLHLLATLIGLIQIGLILERVYGPVAFTAVYLSAGTLASVMSLRTHPVAVSVGASGGILGLLGLLIAALCWGTLQRSSLTAPFTTLRRLVPAVAVFTVGTLATAGLDSGVVTSGLCVGFVCGFVLVIGVGDSKPPARRIVAAAAGTMVVAIVLAIPVRGIANVKSEIARVVAVEDRTSTAYQTAAGSFESGRITAEALAQVIGRTIVPELEAAQAHLRALDKIPREHGPLVATADEYLRLRQESWRLRAEGLRTAGVPAREVGRTRQESNESWRLRAEAQHRMSMRTLGKAEGAERASLAALKGIRMSGQR